MTIERLTVFCGSQFGRDPIYKSSAAALGRHLAERGVGVVFGGGRVGLMGTVADAALEAGGEVIGVLPRELARRELAHEGLTELHLVNSMHERKALMARLGNGFVALPGGLGTLEEIAEILTWAQLGLHRKPCALFDVNDYWRALRASLDHATQEGFLKPGLRALLMSVSTPEELLSSFAAYAPLDLPRWISAEGS
ncbi:MAG: putative cytokinin riboside 5'-monophosphate phosphoribohydrolase [Planctomycetota bacterium]|nr:MAG: putative cytokinin riboside 5'-monophosphate phosphoribohydrolase [Planctomycetota bacterium]